MSYVTFSAQVGDPAGHVKLRASVASSTRPGTRRVEFVDTIDGGSFATDFGFSNVNQKMSISIGVVTKEKLDTIRYLEETYGLVTLATVDGLFSGVITRILDVKRGVTISYNVLEKITS